MNVLGMRHGGHGPGAAIITDQDVFAISEERLNGIKYSRRMFPHLAISYCLELAGLKPAETDLIVSSRDPFSSHLERDKWHKKENLPVREKFLEDFKDINSLIINHHLTHAASSFFWSPFNEATIMTIDGSGDLLNTQTGYIARESDALYFGKGDDIHETHKSLIFC